MSSVDGIIVGITSLLGGGSCVIIYLLSLLAISIMSKVGMMMPYSAGAYGIALASWFNVEYRVQVFIVLSLYMIAMLGNGVSEGEERGSLDVGMLLGGGEGKRNRYLVRLSLLGKIGLLLIFMLLPLPAPPAHLTGVLALVIISVLLVFGGGNLIGFRGEWIGYLAAVLGQGLLIGITSLWVERESDDIGGQLALMCCVSIPAMLFPYRGFSWEREREKKGQEEGEEELHELSFGIVPTLLSCLLCIYTPGLSSSAVAGSLFPQDNHRVLAISGLEGVVEGYVIHQLLNNNLVHKSPLGDLFGVDSIQWGYFTCDMLTVMVLWGAVLLSIAVVCLLPCPSWSKSKWITVAILMSQSLTIAGGSTWLMLVVGFISLAIRRQLSYHLGEQTLGVAFILPTIFYLPDF